MAWFTAIPHYLNAVLDFFFLLFYYLFRAIIYVVNFAESLFKMVAGIDPITINGISYGGESSTDLVYGFILSESVQTLFWTILGFSIVLLVIFTIIALVKSEFTLDLKSSAKGPIIGRAFKAIIQFFLVPTFTILAVFGVNVLTRAINNLFKDGSNNTIIAKCFTVGAKNANRLRTGKETDAGFFQYLSSGSFLQNDRKNENIFGGDDGTYNGTREELADIIDDLFIGNGDYSAIFTMPYRVFDGPSDYVDLEESIGYAPWHIIMQGSPEDPFEGSSEEGNSYSYPMLDTAAFNYFYDPREFDFILAIGTALVIGWNLLTVCLALLKRVFELTILFVLSPAMISLAPLDGEKAIKSWRGEVFSRLVSVVCPIFAYNMFFTFVSLIGDINIFTSSNVLTAALVDVFNVFFQIIVIIVALGLLKTASGMLSKLLGVQDLISEGNNLAGKALSTGTKVALATTGVASMVGGTAIKGTAAAIKGVKRGWGGGLFATARNEIDKLRSQEGKEYRQARRDYFGNARAASSLETAGIGPGNEVYDEVIKRRDEAEAKMASLKPKLKSGDITLSDKNKTSIAKKINEEKIAEVENKISEGAADNSLTQDQIDALWEERAKLMEEHDKLNEKGSKFTETAKSRTANIKKARAGIKSAFTDEFGKDAMDNSFIAKAGRSINNTKVMKTLNRIPGLNLIPGAVDMGAQMFGGSYGEYWSRIRDGFTGVLGKDSAAGTAFNMVFNPQVRESLYQSEDEKKHRDRIRKGNKERDDRNKELIKDEEVKYNFMQKKQSEEQQAKQEREREKILNVGKLYVAKEEKVGEDYNKLIGNLNRARQFGNEEQIKAAKVEIDNFEAKHQLTEKAEQLKTDMADPNNQELYDKFQKFYNTQQLEAQKQALTEQGIKIKEGTVIETKTSSDERYDIAKKIAEVIPNAMRPLTQEMKNVVNGINSLIDILKPKENGGKDKK